MRRRGGGNQAVARRFIDDGNLVYPSGISSPAERLALVWAKIRANYEHLGPFRPVLWAHWEVAAELFHGSEVASGSVFCM